MKNKILIKLLYVIIFLLISCNENQITKCKPNKLNFLDSIELQLPFKQAYQKYPFSISRDLKIIPVILDSSTFSNFIEFHLLTTKSHIIPFGSIIILDKEINHTDSITLMDIAAIETYYIDEESEMRHKIFINSNKVFFENEEFFCKEICYNFSALNFFIYQFLQFNNLKNHNRVILWIEQKDKLFYAESKNNNQELINRIIKWEKDHLK
ncbi:MAG: hypothetical protein NT007_06930 [Candidatus Kapabacteria bacterium]|nr:hypothetical protein [Candidatus Kapabacteria bacterium]